MMYLGIINDERQEERVRKYFDRSSRRFELIQMEMRTSFAYFRIYLIKTLLFGSKLSNQTRFSNPPYLMGEKINRTEGNFLNILFRLAALIPVKERRRKKNFYQFDFVGRTPEDRISISKRIRSSSLLGIFYTKPQEEKINKNYAFCIFWDLVTNFVFSL